MDVAHLQAMPENRHAVFQVPSPTLTPWSKVATFAAHLLPSLSTRASPQVASNFNGVEAISEGSSPDGSSFTEKYIYDLTQGPAASISAGAGAFLFSSGASKKRTFIDLRVAS